MTDKPAKSSGLRRHFLTGLAVGAPVVLTLWLSWRAIVMIDGAVMPLVPRSIVATDSLFRVIPGAGVLIFFVSAVFLGIVTRGFLGRWLVKFSDRIFDRVPVIRTVYGSVKQITDAVFGQDTPKFERACMIEYPRRGCWSIGFISTEARGEIADTISCDATLSIFVPTTPNPTSGFLLFCRRDEVVLLDMGVDDAAKLVISAGLVYPSERPGSTASTS